MDSVNKRGWRTNKHVELWEQKTFDEWKVF
jgi:hypothetical protein